MNIAFIPARSGSKRLKDKNFQIIGDKSLLEIAILTAQKSKVFDDIVMSSNDERAEELSKKYNLNYQFRKENLSGDNIKIWDVVFEYLSNGENKFNTDDKIILLLPTSPFRTEENIQKGTELVEEKKSNVISVSMYKAPIEFSIELNIENQVNLKNNKALSKSDTQSQSFSKKYYPNGNFFGGFVKDYLENKTFYFEPLFAIKTNEIESLDLNTHDDLEYARKINSLKQ